MAKLYFRYGTVGSAKTMNLLAVAHNYEQQGKRVLLVKPALDDRFGRSSVRSRAGLQRQADLLVERDTEIDLAVFSDVDCVLVDESQFLSVGVIDQLRHVTIACNVPVICYGLRTNFRTELFEGAKRLLEVADAIEEVKTTCAFCNRKAVFNVKFVDGRATRRGPEIDLGTEEKYLPACCSCFEEKLSQAVATEESEANVVQWHLAAVN